MYRASGYASRGGDRVFNPGDRTWHTVMASYPGATVTVYLTGTLTLATLYDDEAGLVPKANPFTADQSAYWSFCADIGIYDVRFSGAGIPTFTLPNVEAGVGAGSVSSFNTRQGAVSPAYGDYPASYIVNTPAGSIAATNVQDAIDELSTEKAPLSHTHAESDVTSLVADLAGKASTAHTHPDFVGSGASHAAGIVPDPGAVAGTTKYLREDASWAVPPGGGGGGAVDSWEGRTGSVVMEVGDVFVGSGASHKIGLVPDPGASAGSAKFLREDSSWSVPSAAATTMLSRKAINTTPYDIVLADNFTLYVVYNIGGAVTINIPNGTIGRFLYIFNQSPFSVIVNAGTGWINAGHTMTMSLQYDAYLFTIIDAGTWAVWPKP